MDIIKQRTIGFIPRTICLFKIMVLEWHNNSILFLNTMGIKKGRNHWIIKSQHNLARSREPNLKQDSGDHNPKSKLNITKI